MLDASFVPKREGCFCVDPCVCERERARPFESRLHIIRLSTRLFASLRSSLCACHMTGCAFRNHLINSRLCASLNDKNEKLRAYTYARSDFCPLFYFVCASVSRVTDSTSWLTDQKQNLCYFYFICLCFYFCFVPPLFAVQRGRTNL